MKDHSSLLVPQTFDASKQDVVYSKQCLTVSYHLDHAFSVSSGILSASPSDASCICGQLCTLSHHAHSRGDLKPAQKKTHKLIPDPDMIPALLFLGPISVSGPNRPNTARTFLHLMLLHNKSTHISLNLYFCQQRVYESLGYLCGNSIKWTEISVKQAEA